MPVANLTSVVVHVDNEAVIDVFNSKEYASARYTIQVQQFDNIELFDVLLTSDHETAYVTSFGNVFNNQSLGWIDPHRDDDGQIRIYYTPVDMSAPCIVSFVRTLINRG